jgi:phosphoglycolate phosphatase
VPGEADVHPLIGLPLVDVFRALLPREVPSGDIAQLVEAYRDVYARLIIPATRPFPGVLETLYRYRAGGGRVAVATSKLERVARAAIAASGLAEHVEFLVGHDSVPNSKPAPDMVLRCLEMAGASRGRALVVGDTSYDVEMATRAGVAACAVTYGVHSRSVLQAAGPRRIVDHFADVLPKVESP